MKENYMVCNCKQVSYYDILDTLNNLDKIESVLSAFEDVRKITHCSCGCGGCHDKVVEVISDAMYGYDSDLKNECRI